jgi:hypothetical protein
VTGICVRRSLLVVLCAAAAWAHGARPAYAQQTILNVPSDAVTPVGQQFVLHETQLLPNAPAGNFATTNYYTYGLTDHTEVAVTLYNVDSAGSDDLALGLGFKSVHDVLQHRAPALESKWTFGYMLPVSLGPSSQAVGYFPYTHLAFRVPQTDLRLLGGAAAGSQNLWGDEGVSALAGAEYPLTEHLSFTGEWFSGTHRMSALVPGLTYHRRDLILAGGLKIPNDFDPQQYGLMLEAGFFFGGRHPAGSAPDEERHYGTRLPGYGGLGLGY